MAWRRSPRLHPQIQASEEGAGVTPRRSPRLHPQIHSSEEGVGVTRRIRRRRGTSPATAVSLPDDDDMLREILLRLPPEPSSLPRASAVCRRWRGIVIDPKFHRQFRAHHRKPPLLGFFKSFSTKQPAVPDAKVIQKYRPICLLNVSYKILTKTLANRLGRVIHKVIADTQTAFIKDRFIMEGIALLHETIHEVQHKKQSGVLFKIDFEKAYDKVNWSFLYQMMQRKGFGDLFSDWIMKTVRGGRVAVKVNDQIGPYFPTYSGVRQGDPLAPLLFDIVGDGLAMMINQAKSRGVLTGLVPHLVDNGVAILQYADDTILLIEDSLDCARNMKFVLCMFEQMSGLKINFHKSEIYCLGEAKNREVAYSEIFTCGAASLPMKYLGMPVDEKRLAISQWAPIDDKFANKLSGWKGKILSSGDRVTLVNACLSSLPLYMLSFLEAPKKVLRKWDIHRKRMVWQEEEDKKKYHLVDWDTVCLPKDCGGLGVLDLETMNISLLCKWLWKLENSEGTWQQMLSRKYLHKKVLSQIEVGPGNSHFWQGLVKVNKIFQQFVRRIMNNGEKTLFWTDGWDKGESLAVRYPRLYNLSFDKNITVSDVKRRGVWTLKFRRTLWGELAVQFREIVDCVDTIQLNGESDRVAWILGSSGKFKVRDLYLHLRAGNVVPYKFLWKVKMPLKIKIFVWLCIKNRILTKDNLLKRGWIGNAQCHFCGQNETMDHLLFDCRLAKLAWRIVGCALNLPRMPICVEDMMGNWLNTFPASFRDLVMTGAAAVCWTVWKTRNDACFNKKFPTDPAAVIYKICNLLNDWALLQRNHGRGEFEEGVKKIQLVLREAFSKMHGWNVLPRLTD